MSVRRRGRRGASRARQSFILTSHARPDGDAVGSQLALALALERSASTVRLVARDPVPAPYRDFPGVDRIEIADARRRRRPTPSSCSNAATSTRPGIAGLDRYFVDQRRSPPRQHDVRRRQLVRRVGRGVRRDGRRHHRRARRAVDAGDRRAPVSRHRDRHRRLPLRPDLGAHVRALPAHRRGRRRSGGALAADLRQLRHRPREAHGRHARTRWSCTTATASPCSHFDDALLARVRRDASTTPRASSTCRSARSEVARRRAVQAPGRRRLSASACDRRAPSTCAPSRRCWQRRRPHECRRPAP